MARALALATVASTGGLCAAEYFVARGGSNDRDGLSAGTAWATVAKGISALKPGDVLTILPGTYPEAVTAHLAGTREAPITIRAARPGTVLLRGDVDSPPFRRADGQRQTYWTEFAPRVEGVAERRTLRLYEPMLSLAEVELAPASFFQDAAAGRLYVHPSDGAHPDWHALSLSVTNGFGLLLQAPPGETSVHDVVIDGLSFTGYQARDYPPPPGSRSRWGLHADVGERLVVRRCTAFLNSGGIYLLAATDSVVEDCYAFANFSRFLDLGNNILGWSVSSTVFRRNVVEAVWHGTGTSNGDITFYGGGRYDRKPTVGTMEANLAINAGLMIKGAFGADSVQTGNVVVGHGAYFYRSPDATNLLLPRYSESLARQTYVDPLNHDYRLQSDSPQRGKGPDGRDPGPFPYRDEVFFVSPTGDDGASGTSLKQAWRSLGQAARRASPGQTVYVTAGEYPEALVPAQSGTAAAPIRFRRYGHGRVVIDGRGQLAVGIDLSGRSHTSVQGFMVRDCARHAVRIEGGEALQIEQLIAWSVSGDAVTVADARDVTLRHCLLRSSQGTGLRLASSVPVTVTGCVFEVSGGPRLQCDRVSLAGLWSDANAYPPEARADAVLVAVDDRRFTALAAWQQESGLDPGSVVVAAGYRAAAPETGDFGLRPDSPLLGRGPHASVIGPFLRLTARVPLPVTDIASDRVTTTTANLEWWTPTARVGTVLEWGETPACANRLDCPPATLHTVGLVGLKPGTTYYFRVKPAAAGEELRFAAWDTDTTSTVPGAEAVPAPRSFTTPATAAPPRTFHVAVTGDDSRAGSSAATAWRTLAHAAGRVVAGDTVLVHGGTYEEYVLVRGTGDVDAPVSFRAAPGEVVWLEGSDRFRTTAFRLVAKHHVQIDGFRFRHFRYIPHAGDVISIESGSHHVIRRCLHDGREVEGYVGNFVRAVGTRQLTVENCVMINGMGEGLNLSTCPEAEVRHCVFYNNFIRALTVWQFAPEPTVTLSHNLFCDTIPEKTGNALIRVGDLRNLRADHNGYFTRTGPAERRVVEAANIDGKPVGHQGSGQYHGLNLLLADVRQQAGQEQAGRFGNPQFRAVAQLLPSGAPQAEWRQTEMRWNGTAFEPLDFADFVATADGPLGRAADGQPIGLDPAALTDLGH